MSRIFRHRPSRPMVVALLAVFLSISGSATAAKLITSKQIKNNSVTSRDIRNNSLSGTDIKTGGISGSDLKNGSITSSDFKAGSLPTGPRGAPGAPGANGFGLLAYPFDIFDIAADDPAPDGDDKGIASVDCPTGTFPTGGDAYLTEDDDDTPVPDQAAIVSQYITFDGATPVGYAAEIDNTLTRAIDVGVDVACANATRIQPEKAKRWGAKHKALR